MEGRMNKELILESIAMERFTWRWYHKVNWTAVIVTLLLCLTLLVAWVLWLWMGAHIYISQVA